MADETIHWLLGSQAYHCIALRLHDDLSNTDSRDFEKAKFFREIFPDIKQLPFLMILGPDGKPLSSLAGEDVSKLAAHALQSAASRFPGPEQVLHRLPVYFSQNMVLLSSANATAGQKLCLPRFGGILPFKRPTALKRGMIAFILSKFIQQADLCVNLWHFGKI